MHLWTFGSQVSKAVTEQTNICNKTHLDLKKNVGKFQKWSPVCDLLCVFFKPAHNDKTAHPEVARLMKELVKSRKQLKGQFQNQNPANSFSSEKNQWQSYCSSA